MVGNAEELVWDLFAPIRPDRSYAGQRGGLVARGGALDTPEEELAVGRRIEVPLFDANGPGRTPSLGFRLVVSAPFSNFAGSSKEPGKYDTKLLEALTEAPAKLGARTGSQERDQAARIEAQVAESSTHIETEKRTKGELSAEFGRKLARVGAEAERLRLRLAEAERARIAERVKSGIMLTKAVREFGGVALTIVKGIERVAEDLKREPPEARSELRRRLETLCRDLTDRERQADVHYDLLFGWVDEHARSDEAAVGRAFEKVVAEFRAKRLSVHDDVTALFRQMIDEARRQCAVTGEMRRRHLGEIDLARTRRSTTACTRRISGDQGRTAHGQAFPPRHATMPGHPGHDRHARTPCGAATATRPRGPSCRAPRTVRTNDRDLQRDDHRMDVARHGHRYASPVFWRGAMSKRSSLRRSSEPRRARCWATFTKKSQRAKSTDQLAAAVRNDSGATTREIEELRAGLEKLNGCRARQIRSLGEQLAAGTMDHTTARAGLAEIQRWVAEDGELVADVTGSTEQQTRIYMGAHASVTEPRQLDVIAADWKRYEPVVQPSEPRTLSPPRRAEPRPQPTPPRREPPSVPRVESASARTTDPIRKVAYAQKELEAESNVQKETIERELADLEPLLRTQAFTPAKAIPPA